MKKNSATEKRIITIKHNNATNRFIVASLQETENVARKIARRLRGGDVIALQGELGAGKTTFVQMLARVLGVSERITSPTFILMNMYTSSRETRQKGITILCHIDAYRIRGPHELETIGAREYLGAPGTVTLVEWADRVRKSIPKSAYWIRFRIIA